MKFKALAITAAGLLASGLALADTSSAPFTVSVSFTPKCVATNTAPVVIDFGTYTAGDAAITGKALSAPFAVSCSRGLSPTAAFDLSNAQGGLFSSGNVQYTLSSITKTAGTTGTAASATSSGTADTFTFTFTGDLPQQYGNTTGGALTATRNLVLTF